MLDQVQETVSTRFTKRELNLPVNTTVATSFQRGNIALVKYWGKRDKNLNLPLTSSLSLSLGKLGTNVSLALQEAEDEPFGDSYEINSLRVLPYTPTYARLSRFFAPFRPRGYSFVFRSSNSVPTAAGLASSASAYAAIASALNCLFEWDLDQDSLSRLARLGSGSASRSFWKGFVKWDVGEGVDGFDSFASPIEEVWEDLRWAIIPVDFGKKKCSSTVAMDKTCATSPFMKFWPEIVRGDMSEALEAIARRDFSRLGLVMEASAMAMHALMISSRPVISYFKPFSIETLRWVGVLRQLGLETYATMDAGPNVKILLREKDEAQLRHAYENSSLFAGLNEQPLQIINPFE